MGQTYTNIRWYASERMKKVNFALVGTLTKFSSMYFDNAAWVEGVAEEATEANKVPITNLRSLSYLANLQFNQ